VGGHSRLDSHVTFLAGVFMHNEIRLKGFARGALVDVRGPHKGRVQMGKWHQNAITADGLQNYACGSIGAVAGSKVIGYMQVASQTAAPSTSQTSATGEFTGADGARCATTNSFTANGTLQCVASWATNLATQSALGAVALYNTSATGTAASVATFATSQKTTDQTLSVTYQWRLATA
jgi:hypothetical protein